MVLQSPEVVEVMKNGGLDVEGSTPEQYAAKIKDDLARWATVVKATAMSTK